MTEAFVNGALLLYWSPLRPDASTITEHVAAFTLHSKYKIWPVNLAIGFPAGLKSLRFAAIILHYSPFGHWPFRFDQATLDYLAGCRSSYKIAFFQDEYGNCQQRFAFIRQYEIDCAYTLVDPEYWPVTYGKYTPELPKLMWNIPGYVSDGLVEAARRKCVPDEQRTVDIGYRARRLAPWMGRGSQEKHEIAERVLARAEGLGLKLDIRVGESVRLYGDAWDTFMANCRGVLGVESGVSIFDLDGEVEAGYRRLLAENPQITLAELSERLLAPYEDRVRYRTISPRHFEAAAYRVCQILYEGSYSGIMKPMVHYLPLRKDFSNFEEIMRLFRDPAVRRELTDNAYRDLIASGLYTYREWMAGIDDVLGEAGSHAVPAPAQVKRVEAALRRGAPVRWLRAHALELLRRWRYRPFPGRRVLAVVVRPLLRRRRQQRRRGQPA